VDTKLRITGLEANCTRFKNLKNGSELEFLFGDLCRGAHAVPVVPP
jgi:cold shock CspA family protein